MVVALRTRNFSTNLQKLFFTYYIKHMTKLDPIFWYFRALDSKTSNFWPIQFKKCAKVRSHIACPKKCRTHAHRTHVSECFLNAHERPHIKRVRVRKHLATHSLKIWPTFHLWIDATKYYVKSKVEEGPNFWSLLRISQL